VADGDRQAPRDRRAAPAHGAGRKYEEVGRDLLEVQERTPDLDAALDDPVGDDLLRLVFISCHPCSRPRRGSR
jgi:predicted RNA polymerase sigma factor